MSFADLIVVAALLTVAPSQDPPRPPAGSSAPARPPLSVPQVPAAASNPAAEVPTVTVETEHGSFVIRLRPDLAPKHVAHFLKTAKAGGYDGTTFHRIIPGGMVQGGDPLSKDSKSAARYGTGGLGLLKAEFSTQPFVRGVVAAARRPSSVDSGGSQFFVVLTEQPALKGQYTIFGEVTEGMEVVDEVGATPVEGDKPKARVEIKKVTVR
jgi:peptidyl-prolyl cis-trans isomerase B (cyclophilin B)